MYAKAEYPYIWEAGMMFLLEKQLKQFIKNIQVNYDSFTNSTKVLYYIITL